MEFLLPVALPHIILQAFQDPMETVALRSVSLFGHLTHIVVIQWLFIPAKICVVLQRHTIPVLPQNHHVQMSFD